MDVGKGETVTLTVTERDVWMIRSALQEYLASFSHTEGALVEEIKSLLVRLPTVDEGIGSVNKVFPGGNRLTL
jgi:hypothetical protein